MRVFEDIVSGKSFDRPGLSALLDFARRGDIVCVVRLDRLGRSLKELLETVEVFKSRGLEFRSLEERLDTASAAGELVFHVFGAIAHFERRLIAERTRPCRNLRAKSADLETSLFQCFATHMARQHFDITHHSAFFIVIREIR